MDAIFGLALVLIACLIGLPLLVLPYVVEGIVHLYAPSLVGWLAWVPLRTRELPAGAGTRQVADGYRSVRSEKAPGFETGVWVIGPGEAPHSRVTVTSERSAFVTILAKRRGLLKHFPHALMTVRVRCVDGPDGRRLEARSLPVFLFVPLAIPTYPVALALATDAYRPFDSLSATLPAALLVLGVWTLVWWGVHRDDVVMKMDNALELLEKKIVTDATR